MHTDAADPLFLSFQTAVAGRYSIISELGRGGMGVVYLAREVHLDRLVAIKLLPPATDRSQLRERFLREARLAARLSHPNIIPIHAVDQVDDFVFYVMSYVEGETLATRVRTRGPVSATDGVRMLREVAWALAYAHSQGVVHRDVKPDNILIEAATGRALVADFGIAAVSGDEGDAAVRGTPEFMSPEQALGASVDARSDLYGLGATAFHAFSGRPPFQGRTATEVLARQVTEAPPPLASLGLAVPRKVAALVDQCLAKDRSARPASADALADQLGRAIEQRRTLPAALRGFIRRGGRMDGSGTPIYSTALLGSSIGLSAAIGAETGFATFIVGLMIGPSIFMVTAARRLLDQGFAYADLEPAFHTELESAREERAAEQRRGGAVEWVLSSAARVAASFSALGLPILGIGLALPASHSYAVMTLPAVVGTAVTAVALGMGYLALLQRRRDIDTEFWSAVWLGRPGRMAFAAARRLRGHQPVSAAMTHRATELSLGMAAEQLFDGLPRDARQSLGDLPGLLRRLQHAAHTLRLRYDALNSALERPHTIEDSASGDALREERALVHDKLTAAVGALETIRLNLLRLHAGSAALDGVTTHIELAEDVSAEIERMVAARVEIDASLRFPRLPEPTPV